MEYLFVFLTNLSGNAAYVIIFGVLLACGIGLPLPEDIPLVAAGYLIWDGTISIIPTFLLTMAGVLIGDSMLFYLGKRIGLKFLSPGKNGKSLFKPKRVLSAYAYFRKYGDKIVFFARFIVGFRGMVFFMAGALKMKYGRFLFLDAMAAIVSIPLWILLGNQLGHYFGEEISDLLRRLKDIKHVLTLVIFIMVFIVIIRFILKYRQAKAAESNGDASIYPNH
jgi:membrane protein DedA with SNARE-associated domain